MNGCLDTVFPPASQGHNWNTVTVNPESCELMECVVKEYGWKMSGSVIVISLIQQGHFEIIMPLLSPSLPLESLIQICLKGRIIPFYGL